MNELFILMKHELAVAALIFILLFVKLGKDRSNTAILNNDSLVFHYSTFFYIYNIHVNQCNPL